MILLDLRKAFGYGTEIHLKNGDNGFVITNILWGIPSFFGMKVYDDTIKVIDGKVIVTMDDMPKSVFNAWKKYCSGNERS